MDRRWVYDGSRAADMALHLTFCGTCAANFDLGRRAATHTGACIEELLAARHLASGVARWKHGPITATGHALLQHFQKKIGNEM